MQNYQIPYGRSSLIALVCALLLSTVPAAVAQISKLKDIPPPPEPPGAITLKTTSPSPVTTHESWVEMPSGWPVVQNVSIPTLTPFLPSPDKATGAAIIIAPGGGFFMLGMMIGGWDFARWLQSQGIAAFVLKYRLEPTEPGAVGLGHRLMELKRMQSGKGGGYGHPEIVKKVRRLATDDAKEAMRVVRTRSKEWRIDPNRIGFFGSSAGGTVALNLLFASDPETAAGLHCYAIRTHGHSLTDSTRLAASIVDGTRLG